MILQPPHWSLLHIALLSGKEGSKRRRVYALVAEHPGLHQRDIAHRLAVADATAEHHLRHLVKAGLLTRQRGGVHMRYYVAIQGPVAPAGAVAAADRPRLAILRKARPLQVVATLLAQGPLTMGVLADVVGLSAATLTHHVTRLEEAGLVQRRQEGRERFVDFVDRDDTVRLLLAYEPPADLVAGFQDLWDEVGV